MELLYQGKTKDVFDDGDGALLLQFKDDVTGENGVFDPGANTVGLQIPGVGKENLAMSAHFFGVLEQQGIRTHFLSADPQQGQMRVRRAQPFGQGIEVICRRKATGSFVRRYGSYITDGTPLDSYVEVTIKDDDRGDPPITMEGLAALGIMTEDRYRDVVELTKRITGILAEQMAAMGLDLIDIKYEFGEADGELLLIDEIASGNMRVWRDGQSIEALDLTDLVLTHIGQRDKGAAQ